MKDNIIAKVKLGIPLTKREESLFLLFYASSKEVNQYLKNKKQNKNL